MAGADKRPLPASEGASKGAAGKKKARRLRCASLESLAFFARTAAARTAMCRAEFKAVIFSVKHALEYCSNPPAHREPAELRGCVASSHMEHIHCACANREAVYIWF